MALFLVIGVNVFGQIAPIIYEEQFTEAPVRWEAHGETNLFSWEAGELEVTWDSSRTNSFFYLPLGVALTGEDDFALGFTLRLQDIGVGTNPEKPYTFQIAAGLINLTNAFDPAFFRGSGVNIDHGARNLVEFDYFPDSGFGATVAPTIVTKDNQIAYSHNHPLVLVPGVQYRVEMSYWATNGVLRTTMTADGEPFGLPPDETIQDIVLASRFTNFVVNAFAICSYSDAGQSPPEFAGSVLAHGIIDDVRIEIYHRPKLEVTVKGGEMNLSFLSELDWSYMALVSTNLADWELTTNQWEGTGEIISAPLTMDGSMKFFRIAGVQQ